MRAAVAAFVLLLLFGTQPHAQLIPLSIGTIGTGAGGGGGGGGGEVCTGRNFYVSSSGNNSSNGTSVSTPWQSLAKVSTGPVGGFVSGDCINLQGGTTFTGCTAASVVGNSAVILNKDVNVTSSTNASRITLRSYGTGRATISPSSPCGGVQSSGVHVDAVNVTITNLIVDIPMSVQTAWSILVTNRGGPIAGFSITGNELYPGNITGLSLDHFGSGVYVDGTYETNTVTGDVSNNDIHGHTLVDPVDNGVLTKGQNGIASNHITGTNVFVSVTGNDIWWIGGHRGAASGTGGNGIVLTHTTNNSATRNRIRDSGANNNTCGGPAGAWTYEAEYITIADNEAYNMEPASTLQGYISGTTLTVTSVPAIPHGQNAVLSVGSNIKMALPGTPVQDALITARGTGTGGVGTYTIDTSQTVGLAGSPATIGFAPYFDDSAGACDWSGFNMDGSVYNSVIERNIAHHNFGTGITTCIGCDTNTWGPNTLRYNLSIADGAGPFGGNGLAGLGVSNDAVGVVYYYGNTFIQNEPQNAGRNGLWGNRPRAVFAFQGDRGPASGSLIANNILAITPGNTFAACNMYSGTAQLTDITWRNNDYYLLGGASFLAGENEGSTACNQQATSFASWTSAVSETGAANTNPVFATTPSSTGTPALFKCAWTPKNGENPRACAEALKLQLQTSSPAIGTGLNVASLVGGSMGTLDYFGTAIPHGTGSGYNKGADGAAHAAVFSENFAGGYSANWNVGMPWEAGNNVLGGTYIQVDPAVTPSLNPFTTDANGLQIVANRTNGNSASQGKAYYTGLLSSKASRIYGYYEFVASMPGGPGAVNGALWLYPTGPSNNAEIDVIEHRAGTVMQTVWDGSGTNPTHDTNVSGVTGLHTYAVDWQSDYITFYIDNAQTYQTVTPANSKTVPMMVILSVNVADPTSDGTSLPQHMTVKSVGIWANKAARGTVTVAGPRVPVGPQASITCPAGSTTISTASNIQTIVNANAAGTSYCLASGTHSGRQVVPKNGDTFTGTYGAIMDGGGTAATAFSGSATAVTLQNIVVTNYKPGVQRAVIGKTDGTGVDGWTIKNMEVKSSVGTSMSAGCSDCGATGIAFQNGSTIVANYIHDHPSLGFSCYGPNDIITDNEIARNNPWSAGVQPQVDPGWEAGGNKCWNSDGETMSFNWSHDNGGPGLWFDSAGSGTWNTNATISNNKVTGNYYNGIMWEVSKNAVISYNDLSGNGGAVGTPWTRTGTITCTTNWLWCAEILSSSSAADDGTLIDIHHNKVVSSTNGGTISIVSQNSRNPATGHDSPRDTRNTHVYNNTVTMTSNSSFGLDSDYVGGGAYSDNNSFQCDSFTGGQSNFFWNGGGKSLATFRSNGQESNGGCAILGAGF